MNFDLRSVDKAMKFLSCGMCILQYVPPMLLPPLLPPMPPSPSSSMSLAGRRRHHRRSRVTVTTAIARSPSPSSSLAGRHHHRCRSLAVAIAVAHRSPSPSPSLAGRRCHHHRCNYPIYQVRLCVIRYCGASRVWSIRCVRDGHGSTGDRTAILVTILQNSPSFHQQS